MAGREMRPRDAPPRRTALFRRLWSGRGHCQMTATSSTRSSQRSGLGGKRPVCAGWVGASSQWRPGRPIQPQAAAGAHGPRARPPSRHAALLPCMFCSSPVQTLVVRACLGNQDALRGPFQLVMN